MNGGSKFVVGTRIGDGLLKNMIRNQKKKLAIIFGQNGNL